jgi:hypothetical protein
MEEHAPCITPTKEQIIDNFKKTEHTKVKSQSAAIKESVVNGFE